MSRHELTNEQWAVLEPLFPQRGKGRGRPRADDRTTLNGILYVLKTGCAWMDMPRQYGAYATCWRRLRQWAEDGTWERVWQALLGQLEAQGKIEWEEAFLDSSFVAAKKGAKVPTLAGAAMAVG